MRAPVGERWATAADAAEIARVVNAAYRVEDFFVHGDRTSAEDVRTRLAQDGAGFLVVDAAEPGRLAAVVFAAVRGARGYFGMLAVDPAAQGMGHGRRLVASVESHCRAAGCEAIDIEVVDLRDELPAFYARLGYRPAGEAPFGSPEKLRRPAKYLLFTKALAPSRD